LIRLLLRLHEDEIRDDHRQRASNGDQELVSSLTCFGLEKLDRLTRSTAIVPRSPEDAQLRDDLRRG